MAGLAHLKDVLDKQGKEFVDKLLNKTVIVNEKMDGAFFGAKRDSEEPKFKFFKRNGELTYVDRVLSKYFEPAIKHFESLPPEVMEKVPIDYLFGMEYFTGKKAQNISYDHVPKNHLILSYIHIQNNAGEVTETVQSKDELNKWADILEIERPPIIFQGKLTPEQKKQIQEFIYSPFDQLVDKFKTTSFTRYIMSILNPDMSATFLRDSLDKDIEGIVFRFYEDGKKTEDPVFLAKLVDPVFQANAKERAMEDNQKKSDDYIWIIVIDLMNFIEKYTINDLRNIETEGESYEEKYISLVNHIYLDFIKSFGEKYRDLDIQIPEFLQREDFNVNYNLIKNPRVTAIIESNPNFKEIYRVFLNMFRKKKIRVSSTFFTKAMRDNLNSQIDKISKVIMGDTIYENYFPTFGEFVGEDNEPGYFEAFKDKEDRKTKPVNLIISDFQPIHPGHIKSAQGLFNQNGLPCVLVCVHSGTTNKIRPLKIETIVSALSKLENIHPSFIAGHVIIPDGEIETLLREVRPMYEPNIIAASKSRVRDLALQIELARKRSRNLNLKKDLRLMELPAAGLKETILTTLKNGDYAAFKEAAPQAIHSEFFNMNKDVSETFSNYHTKAVSESIESDPVVVEEITESDLIMESLNPYVGYYKMEAEKILQALDELKEAEVEFDYVPEKNFVEISTDDFAKPYEIVKNNGGVQDWSVMENPINCILIKAKSQIEVPPGAMM